MLIITAPGRCGTSLVALYCKLLGYDPGGEWDVPSNSGLECPKVQITNAAIRNRSEDVPAMIKACRRVVAKNCLFFRYTEIVNAWHAEMPGLKFLALWRNPVDQYHSWQMRPDYTPSTRWPRNEFIEWTVNCRVTFTANCERLSIPVRWLEYPDFLDQQELLVEYLHWDGLAFDDQWARYLWDDLVDRSLIHHRTLALEEELSV